VEYWASMFLKQVWPQEGRPEMPVTVAVVVVDDELLAVVASADEQ